MVSSIYLTGSTVNPAEWMGQVPEPDWRSKATSMLNQYGMRVLNPLELPWSGAEEELRFENRIHRQLDLIDQCDALLANVSKPSYGTAMELFYAYKRGKVVTVVGQSPFSPWVVSHSQTRFCDVEQALEYLIGEQPHLDPVSWTLQYERQIADHYEQFPIDGEPDYKFMGGDLPILVLSPHATAYFRDGQFYEPEAFTGSTAALLNRWARCHSLISNYCMAADPLWYIDTPMRRALADVVKVGEVGLVIVLLGAPWLESSGLKMSVLGPQSTSLDEISGRMRLSLSALEPVVSESDENIESAPLLKLLSEELNLPTIVLNLHKRYRMPRLQPAPFVKLVSLLEEFIRNQGTEFIRSRQ